MHVRVTIVSCVLCLLLACCLPGYGQTAVTAEAATAEAATARAADFATGLTMPWAESTEAVLRENINPARKAEWVVKCGAFSSVGVDPRTGRITSAVDYSAALTHALTPAPVKLDKAAAVARATDILTRAGLLQAVDAKAPEVRFHESDPGAWRLSVKFPCVYQGIPYQYGGATVLLGANDGAFLALSSAVDVAPPADTTVTVDEKAAADSALALSARVSASDEPVTASATLMIVVPNSFWITAGVGAKEDGTVARTAWVVTVSKGERLLVFWIDAADGRVLGGTRCL